MNLKQHVLAALREQLEDWDALLAGLDAAQIAAPLTPEAWTIKDVMAHLWAWQQVSTARIEAALQKREPRLPAWFTALGSGAEEDPDRVNAWVYRAYHAAPWEEIHAMWREGYRRLLELCDPFTEQDLLDWGRYPWLEHGIPLVLVLIATYNHHQEHYEKIRAWPHPHGEPHGSEN
jgi:hypothetical protein